MMRDPHVGHRLVLGRPTHEHTGVTFWRQDGLKVHICCFGLQSGLASDLHVQWAW